MKLKIIETYDGRLPEYQVIQGETIIKIFDSLEEANQWCRDNEKNTPCGEEDPCS